MGALIRQLRGARGGLEHENQAGSRHGRRCRFLKELPEENLEPHAKKPVMLRYVTCKCLVRNGCFRSIVRIKFLGHVGENILIWLQLLRENKPDPWQIMECYEFGYKRFSQYHLFFFKCTFRKLKMVVSASLSVHT